MRKKNHGGWYYDRVTIFIIMPIVAIILLIFIFLFAKDNLTKYFEQKKYEEVIKESEKQLQESIRQSESYEKFLQQQYKIEKEEKEKREKEDAVRQRRINTEYQNKIFSQYWKKGTYIYDKVNRQYGIVDHCEIPHVITKEGWYFIADESNDYKNKDIIQVGWLQWHNWTMKELNKKGQKESERINLIILEELKKREQEAIKKFPKNPKYCKVKYQDNYYYITDWKDGRLKLVKRDDIPSKPKKIIIVEFDDKNLKQLTYNEIINFYVK